MRLIIDLMCLMTGVVQAVKVSIVDPMASHQVRGVHYQRSDCGVMCYISFGLRCIYIYICGIERFSKTYI